MSILAKKSLAILLALPLLLALSGPATATVILPDPDPPNNSFIFGDFNVFSLALLNFNFGGGIKVQPGEPFSVQSSPGQLKDDIVIGTGANGVDNLGLGIDGLLDDPYDLPGGNGADGFFGTKETTDPSPDGDPWDMAKSWDIDGAALQSFLLGDPGTDDDSALVFYFNLDETGKNDNLASNDLLAWAVVTLYNLNGSIGPQFVLSGEFPPPATDKIGPIPSADGKTIGPGFVDQIDNATGLAVPGLGGPGDGVDDRWAYVHGRICVDLDTGLVDHLGPCDGSEIANVATIEQNLGSNQAAFALFNKELSDLILNSGSTFLKLSIDFRFGAINNGFEQVFIRKTQFGEPTRVPEPGTLSLFGLGLLALGIRLRRRKLS